MLDRWFGVKIHHYLHVLGMMVLAFGLPMNKVLMSIGAIWGVSNLVLEANFSSYWKNIKSNKTYLVLLGLFIFHVIAIIWSNNLSYAFHDLRIKLPLLAVPLALVAHPISNKKEIYLILLTFLLSLLICSGINFNYFLESISSDSPEKFREMSLFGSHIRFAILIIIGAVISAYFSWKLPKFRIVFIALTFWFLIYTFYSQVISGMLSLFGALLSFFLYIGWKYKFVRVASVSFIIASTFVSIYFIQSIGSGNLKNPSVKLEKYTAQGHVYYHDTLHPVFEQGKYIYIHISEEELIVDWPKYSKLNFMGKDAKNRTLRETIYRYMTAKDLKKDAEGLSKLSKEDIENIENGIPSPQLLNKGILSRFNTIRYQIENANNPNGQSLLQRIEYWKTGIEIIKENTVFGVGTGDVQDAFNEQYVRNKTKLHPEYWFRAHNMFLTIQLTFGILGSFLFIYFLFSFVRKNYKERNILSVCLFGVIIVSFFIEDTLETQTGVSLFSLFFGLFLVPKPKSELTEQEK